MKINCLNCGKEVEQNEGRRPKKFCDEKCRNAAHRKKVSELLKQARQPMIQDLTFEQPKTNFIAKVLTPQRKAEIEAKIAELEAEIKKTPNQGIGARLIAKYRADIDKLEKELNS